ncbi:MAG: hypothetical protein ACYC5N_06845 [Endomicrobiales bacterium]
MPGRRFSRLSGKGALGEKGGRYVLLSAGYSPVAFIDDADNHVLRHMYTTARLQGDAWKVSLQGRYARLPDWFLNARGDLLYFDMRGRDRNLIYGCPDQGTVWSIDHRTSSTQLSASVVLGVRY